MKENPKIKINLKQQTKFTPEQLAEFDKIEQHAIANFSGDLTELESALGMFKLGHQFGWKPLYLIHSKATIRKYEGILGITVRDMYPAEGPGYQRMYIYRIMQGISNFWKVVSGEEKVADKKLID